MKKIFTLVTVCCFLSTIQAQQLQWIRGGGSIINGTGLVSDEYLAYLQTDSNRNVYAASQVFGQNLKADSFYVPFSNVSQGFGKILLTSYKCDGTMRWAKLIEGNGTTVVYGMNYDGGANIYVAGTANGSMYIGSDTIINLSVNRSFLLKLDTLGAFKWIRFVGTNNVLNGSPWSALAIDAAGTIHHYVHTRNGGVDLSPNVTSIKGTYNLKYSPSGILQSVTPLNIDSGGVIQGQVTMNRATGTIYTLIHPNPDFTNNHPYYIAAIASNGNALWRDTLGGYGAVVPSYYDGKGNIYAGGAGANGSSLPFTIKNQSVTNTSYNGVVGLVVKLDTLGNVKWIYKNESNLSVCGLGDVVPMADGRLFSPGYLGGRAKSGNDSIVIPQQQGQEAYYAILDTGGNHFQFGRLYGNGFYDRAFTAVTDKAGSIYFGTQTSDTIRSLTNPSIHYKSNGGSSDFFIAKYGFGCNCTVAPTANYTKTLNNATKTATFTYTGTTTALDSLVWQWGDGQKLKVTSNYTTPVSHTYASVGTYNATVTAYSGCGTNAATQAVQFTMGIGSMDAFAGGVVYPNPTTDVLTIESVEKGTAYGIVSIVGQQVQTGIITSGKHTVSLRDLPAGTYMLVLTGKDGKHGSVHIIKL